MKIGDYNDFFVSREAAHGMFLSTPAGELLLPAREVPPDARPGRRVTVFVYPGARGELTATTRRPHAVVNEFACLVVRKVTPYGAVLDWGLARGLLVPRHEQGTRMQVGQRHVVKVLLDSENGRIYATARIAAICEKAPEGWATGRKVSLLVWRLTPPGIQAVVENRYAGLLSRNEPQPPLAVGDRADAYVSRVRADGKIELTLKKPGVAAFGGSDRKVLQALEKAGGFLAYHDKTPPDEIVRRFAISKKEFKRTIGHLYKKRKIEILADGIRLLPPSHGRRPKR